MFLPHGMRVWQVRDVHLWFVALLGHHVVNSLHSASRLSQKFATRIPSRYYLPSNLPTRGSPLNSSFFPLMDAF